MTDDGRCDVPTENDPLAEDEPCRYRCVDGVVPALPGLTNPFLCPFHPRPEVQDADS